METKSNLEACKRRLKKYSFLPEKGKKSSLKGVEGETESAAAHEGKELKDVIFKTLSCVGAIIGGGMLGAALGKFSLAVAIPAVGYGVYKNNLPLICAGAGMLIARSSTTVAQEAEKAEGYFSLSATGNRIQGFLGDMKSKLFLGGTEESITSSAPKPSEPIAPKAEIPEGISDKQENTSQVTKPEKAKSNTFMVLGGVNPVDKLYMDKPLNENHKAFLEKVYQHDTEDLLLANNV